MSAANMYRLICWSCNREITGERAGLRTIGGRRWCGRLVCRARISREIIAQAAQQLRARK